VSAPGQQLTDEDGTAARIDARRAELSRWYAACGRHDLDWRLTRDRNAVLVSEVMLQQTQVNRVLPYYRDWLARWPTVEALADASLPDVIRAWAGLGYNRRARYLHDAGRAVVEEHGSVFPTGATALQALPGIGPYTARAVACFAFDAHEPVVEANTGRVIARFALGVGRARDATPRNLWDAAREMLPERGARDHNLALMDVGAMVCTAREPRCGECPLASACAWRLAGYPEDGRGPSQVGSTVRFEDTSRFARGRIIALLRSAGTPVLREEIAAYLPGGHADQVDAYLDGLARDGLAEESGSGWQLPGA
jgi:A/G-specific adenine glycosylase